MHIKIKKYSNDNIVARSRHSNKTKNDSLFFDKIIEYSYLNVAIGEIMLTMDMYNAKIPKSLCVYILVMNGVMMIGMSCAIPLPAIKVSTDLLKSSLTTFLKFIEVFLI